MQGMLTHVVVHQPEDPVAYFHEELSRIKKEVEENNVRLFIPILRSLSCLISGSLVYNYSYTALYTSSNAFRPVCLKRGDAK